MSASAIQERPKLEVNGHTNGVATLNVGSQPTIDEPIEYLSKQYAFIDGLETHDFLRDYPETIDTLIRAVPRIDSVFGAGTPKSLLIVFDPETNGERELSVLITQDGTVVEALEKLERFCRNWATAEFRKLKGRLNFDVVFP
jgi:hypothetical protein